LYRKLSADCPPMNHSRELTAFELPNNAASPIMTSLAINGSNQRTY
jgi:hypothetical protein